jgi:hypothetical protein
MQQFPLLDLQSAWDDAHTALQEIVARAETLYDDSQRTWHDMARVRLHATVARAALGTLPAAIMEGIAKDQQDLDELEAQADG